jgi:hypothetical protein
LWVFNFLKILLDKTKLLWYSLRITIRTIKERRMTQLSKYQLTTAISELDKGIPPAPNGVIFEGIRIENGEDEDLSVRVDFPRWFRHPEGL